MFPYICNYNPGEDMAIVISKHSESTQQKKQPSRNPVTHPKPGMTPTAWNAHQEP